MNKAISLFLSCAAIFTSLEVATPLLNPALASSNQDSGDHPSKGIASPDGASIPLADNSGSGLAEKGKPIIDRNSVICPQILKADNNSNKSSEDISPTEGNGQFPSSCLHVGN